MDILVVGSVALDTIETPFGKVENVLGGSATYFSVSATFFSDVCIVAVVGDDFPKEHMEFLSTKNVDIRGIEVVKGETFKWKGKYGFDLNEAITIDTQLNVFQHFKPKIPQEYRDVDFVFLANIDPELQYEVLRQIKNPRLVACDTMNFWIEKKQRELYRLLEKVDIFIINESEARQLSGEPNLIKASKKILDLGPNTLIIKRGEYGALMFSGDSIFSAPGYPLEYVFDPTGAGDTFAGGFIGFISNTNNLSESNMRRAIIFGSVMASFNVEDFSLFRLSNLSYNEIEKRYREFKSLSHFENI